MNTEKKLQEKAPDTPKQSQSVPADVRHFCGHGIEGRHCPICFDWQPVIDGAQKDKVLRIYYHQRRRLANLIYQASFRPDFAEWFKEFKRRNLGEKISAYFRKNYLGLDA